MWLISASIGWAALGYFAFAFRIVQFRAYPRGSTEKAYANGETQEAKIDDV